MKNEIKKKHDNLFFFFTATLAWTWFAGLVPLLFNSVDMPTKDVLFKIYAGATPSLIALGLVFLTYTKSQRKDYFNRAFSLRRMGLKWPLLTMAYFAVVLGVTVLVSVNFMGGTIPGFDGIHTLIRQPYMIFSILFFGMLYGPINEEFGWRGFALDRLLVRFGFWKGSMILGFIWGIWHLPWFFYPGNSQYEWWQTSPIHGIIYPVYTAMLAGVVTVVYIKTNRSTLAGAFVHMIGNIFSGALVYPYDAPYDTAVLYVTLVLNGLVVLYFARNIKFQSEVKHQIFLFKNDFY